MLVLVCSETEIEKVFERILSSFWAKIKPPITLTLKEYPRPPYAHRDFDKLRVDFPELGGYFDVPETVNYLLMWLGSR